MHHITAAKEGYETVQHKIKRYLQIQLGPKYHYEDETDIAVTFIYQSNGMSLKVDLLLSPYWESQEKFFQAMADLDHRKRLMLVNEKTKQNNNKNNNPISVSLHILLNMTIRL